MFECEPISKINLSSDCSVRRYVKPLLDHARLRSDVRRKKNLFRSDEILPKLSWGPFCRHINHIRLASHFFRALKARDASIQIKQSRLRVALGLLLFTGEVSWNSIHFAKFPKSPLFWFSMSPYSELLVYRMEIGLLFMQTSQHDTRSFWSSLQSTLRWVLAVSHPGSSLVRELHVRLMV